MVGVKHRLLYYWFRRDKEETDIPPGAWVKQCTERNDFLSEEAKEEKFEKEKDK